MYIPGTRESSTAPVTFLPPPGEKVRMRGHKGTVESRQHLYVMLNLFQHLATVEFHGYSKRPPQGRNMGQTLNQVQGDMKMLDCTPAKPVEPSNCVRPTCFSTSSRNGKEWVKRALLPCGADEVHFYTLYTRFTVNPLFKGLKKYPDALKY